MSGPSGRTDETIDRRSRNRDPVTKLDAWLPDKRRSRPVSTQARFVGTGPFHGTAYAD